MLHFAHYLRFFGEFFGRFGIIYFEDFDSNFLCTKPYTCQHETLLVLLENKFAALKIITHFNEKKHMKLNNMSISFTIIYKKSIEYNKEFQIKSFVSRINYVWMVITNLQNLR